MHPQDTPPTIPTFANGIPHYVIDEAGCWLWQGRLRPDGHGGIDGKGTALAHRYYVEAQANVTDHVPIPSACRAASATDATPSRSGRPVENEVMSTNTPSQSRVSATATPS